VHLRVVLPDGSVGCLPLAWTELADEIDDSTGLELTVGAVREVMALVGVLQLRVEESRGSALVGK